VSGVEVHAPWRGPQFRVSGRNQPDAEELRWALANVTADEERICSIIQERSNLTGPEITGFFREQRRLTAMEAMAAGIVHEVKEVRIPRGSPTITVEAGRYRWRERTGIPNRQRSPELGLSHAHQFVEGSAVRER
jgi:hypothetical protein